MNKKICEHDGYRTFKSYDSSERLIDTSGERELWAAVIYEAIESSKIVIDHNMKKDSREKKVRERRRARSFILSEKGMFNWICEKLDMDQDAARSRIVQQWKTAGRGGK